MSRMPYGYQDMSKTKTKTTENLSLIQVIENTKKGKS
jgi:hypothetical protein